MSYGDSQGVAAFCPNLTSGSSDFSQSTTPTLAQVDSWLEDGASHIEFVLNACGYSTPVAETSVVFYVLRRLNNLFAAATSEMARANIRLAPGERTRGQVFAEMYEKELERLVSRDLTRAGVGVLSTGVLYCGGIDSDDKDTIESDTSRVAPRFKRDLFRFPGTEYAGAIERQEREEE